MARTINFFDGAQSGTTPTIGNIVASNLVQYANDAAFEAGEQGAPTTGNIYYNTTDNQIRFYNGTQWVPVVDEESTQTLNNKTIDGTDATGTNTVTNDATDVSYDNTTSLLTATNAQAAIDEVESRVDTNETNISTNAGDILDLENLSGSPGATDHGTFTGTIIPDGSTTKGALQALETETESKVDTSQVGAPSGVASLDGSGRIPSSQLAITVAEYLGAWNAATNTPSIADGSGTSGDFYRVSTGATRNLGSGNIEFVTGDAVIYNGSVWEKIPESAGIDWSTPVDANVVPDSANSRLIGTTALPFSEMVANTMKAKSALGGTFVSTDAGNLERFRLGNNLTGPDGVSNSVGFQATENVPGTGRALFTTRNINSGSDDSVSVEVMTGNNNGSGDSGDLILGTGTPNTGNRGTTFFKTGTIDFGNSPSANVPDPVDPQAIATKNYVDSLTSGASGITYVAENFEMGVAALVPYADAAANAPVDGTGGSPSVTVTAETVAPLRQTQSAKITKDAANRQGEGASILSETVDEAYSDKVHTVELLWKTDANYSDGDMSLWVIHPTAGTVEALNFRTALGEYTNELPASSDTVTRIVSELTPIDPTYRIAVHIGSTTATAYQVLVDDIRSGPQRTFNAPIVTEWVSYSPTYSSGSGTVTNSSFKYRRVGDTLEVFGSFTTGTVSSGVARIGLPSGLNIDTTKISSDQTDISGTWFLANTAPTTIPATSRGPFVITPVPGTTTSEVLLSRETNTSNLFFSAISWTTIGSLFEVSVKFTVPIDEWDAGAAFSTTQVDQQTPVAKITGDPPNALAGAPIIVPTVQFDTNNAYDNSTGLYTAPRAGKYVLHGSLVSGTLGGIGVQGYVNGVDQGALGFLDTNGEATFTGIVDAQTGDTISIRPSSNLDAQAVVLNIHALPDFTTFGTFPEKNLVQTKTLSSDVSSNGTVSDLTFNNLTIGKWYEFTGQIYCVIDSGAADVDIQLAATHDGNTVGLALISLNETTDSSSDVIMQPLSGKFQASATSLTFVSSFASANSRVAGNGSRGETYIQLEERNDLRETSKF